MPKPFEDTVVVSSQSRPKRKRRRRPKRQPPYAVILHNDNANGFEFVVTSIQKVFGYNDQKAFLLTLTAHHTGRSCLWTGHRELAELKADQLVSCGPDPQAANASLLRVSVEPVAGD